MNLRSIYTAAVVIIVAGSLSGCSDEDKTGAGPIGVELSARVTAPLDGARVADIVDIIVAATDDKGIAKVEFFVNANKIGEDAVAPYTQSWNTTGLADGSVHSLYGVAFDTDGNKSGTAPILCTIDTTVSAPQASTLIPPTDITDSSVTLTWSQNADNDFSAYVITWDTAAVAPLQLGSRNVTSQADTSIMITSLRDNALYHFQVTTLDLFDNQGASAIVQAHTVNVAPPQPALIGVTSKTGNLTFRWVGAEILDFMNYEIVLSNDTLFDSGDSTLVTITDIHTIQTTIVFPDTGAFTFFLTVHDTSGLSSTSPGVQATTISVNFALQFDGSQYATIPYFAALDVGNQYTLEAWINMSSAATYMRVIDKSPTTSPWLQYSLICDPQPGADVCNGNSPARFHANATVALNEWHHVALTYNNGAILYFVDGSLVDSSLTGISQTCAFPTTLNIGRRKMFDEFYFRGMIDEVRVWNSVRSPSEISSTFNLRLTGSEPGLVCYYDFDEGTGDAISSPVGGNGHLGEISGADSKDPSWVTSTAPIAN